MIDDKKLKENIARLRELKSISQTEMAERLGISRNAFRSIEKGCTMLISDRIDAIAEVLGVTTEELMLDMDSPVSVMADVAEKIYKTNLDALRNENDGLRSQIAIRERLLKRQEENLQDKQATIDLLRKRIAELEGNE